MNRNKIFLGATTVLLALAGIAAAKQQKHTARVLYTTANVDCTVTCTKTGVAAVTTFNYGQSRAFLDGHFVCYTIDQDSCVPLYSGL